MRRRSCRRGRRRCWERKSWGQSSCRLRTRRYLSRLTLGWWCGQIASCPRPRRRTHGRSRDWSDSNRRLPIACRHRDSDESGSVHSRFDRRRWIDRSPYQSVCSPRPRTPGRRGRRCRRHPTPALGRIRPPSRAASRAAPPRSTMYPRRTTHTQQGRNHTSEDS